MGSSGYQYHGQVWTDSGCEGTWKNPGWYKTGTYNLVTSAYRNPSTGMAYTPTELAALGGGTTTPAATTPTTTTPATTTPAATTPTTSQLEAGTTTPTTYMSFASWLGAQGLSAQALDGQEKTMLHVQYNNWLAKLNAAATTPATTTPAATTPTTSQLEAGTTPLTPEQQVASQAGHTALGPGPSATPSVSNLEVAAVPTLPPYKPSAQMEELSNQVGGAIGNIIEQGGIGMGEDTKEALFLREAEIINANTAQANKNLEDKMAAQGLSNSGMAFSEGMKLASKGTIAMANVMRDVEIQDSLMKVASYQNALGMGVQFLSYLSEESWRQYQPTLYQWQAKVDMYKLAIQDAYNKQDLALAHRYDMEMAQFTASTNIQLTQMTIDAAAKAADKANFMEILGTIIGGVASVASAFLMV